VTRCDSPAFVVLYRDTSDHWYVRSVDGGYNVMLRFVDGDWQVENAGRLILP